MPVCSVERMEAEDERPEAEGWAKRTVAWTVFSSDRPEEGDGDAPGRLSWSVAVHFVVTVVECFTVPVDRSVGSRVGNRFRAVTRGMTDATNEKDQWTAMERVRKRGTEGEAEIEAGARRWGGGGGGGVK